MEVAALCLDRLFKKTGSATEQMKSRVTAEICFLFNGLALVLVSITILLIPSYVSASIIKEFYLRSSLDHICIF